MRALTACWTATWKIGLFLGLWGTLLAVVILPFGIFFPVVAKQHPVQFQLYFDAGGALSILLASWLLTRFMDRRPFSSLGFASDRPARLFLLGLAIGIGWLASSLVGLTLVGGARYEPEGSVIWSLLTWSATALLLNTLTQQLLGFGYLFHTIRAQSNTCVAIVLAALLFALLHLGAIQGSAWAAANVFGAGVLFGVAQWVTGSLWMSIGIHYAWNLLLGPVLGLVVSGQKHLSLGWRFFHLDASNPFGGGDFGPEGSPIVTVTTWLLIGSLLVYHRFSRGRPSPSLRQLSAASDLSTADARAAKAQPRLRLLGRRG